MAGVELDRMQVKPCSARSVGERVRAADFDYEVAIGVREFHIEAHAVFVRLELRVQGEILETRDLLGIENFSDMEASFRDDRAVRYVRFEADAANPNGLLGEFESASFCFE